MVSHQTGQFVGRFLSQQQYYPNDAIITQTFPSRPITFIINSQKTVL